MVLLYQVNRVEVNGQLHAPYKAPNYDGNQLGVVLPIQQRLQACNRQLTYPPLVNLGLLDPLEEPRSATLPCRVTVPHSRSNG